MRKLTIIAAFTFIAMLVLPATAFAASPSQLECEAAGGTFERSGGQVSCTFTSTENVGKAPANSNAQQTTVEEEESSNGTLNNQPKYEESTECTGPPGQCKQRV